MQTRAIKNKKESKKGKIRSENSETQIIKWWKVNEMYKIEKTILYGLCDYYVINLIIFIRLYKTRWVSDFF